MNPTRSDFPSASAAGPRSRRHTAVTGRDGRQAPPGAPPARPATGHRILPRVMAKAMAGLAAAAGPALAAPGSAELALQGSGPYHTVHLPMALHTRAASSDFGSLRVLNARGEALPFAWRELPPPAAEESRRTVPFFKQPGVTRQPARPPAWVLDTRQLRGSLQALELRLPEGRHGAYTLALDSSTDLQHWQSVLPRLQVLWLEHQGLRLEQASLPLGGVPPGYLRLSPIEGSELPPLAAAEVTALSSVEQAPALQWSEPIAPSGCGPRHCDYPLPAQLPLAQLQVVAHEPNALAEVQLLGQEAAAPAAGPPHGLRERLRALRHKQRPPAPPGWLPLASTSVYWLRLPEGEFRSPALPFDAGVWPQLRLQTEGPITQLGQRPPSLKVAAETRSLVFLARGPAPYRLAWGGDERQAGAPVALQQLLPLRRPGEPLPADTASLSLPAAAAPAVASASSPAPVPARPAVAPGLWAVLAGGLALMGWMAWSLLRKRPPAE
ncbi:DUF3999 family protein [Eleftheria terrae]|uniref:DUF3999 family protein n=1 Tax=Eleftheria terrae TaxID=1597781 RepID=UPI00263A99BD|nr:DUF3999 family protein [Eleftheria terrae]WKB54076.1 DUF3999 domain-containing protein [Eleftheria terrae]